MDLIKKLYDVYEEMTGDKYRNPKRDEWSEQLDKEFGREVFLRSIEAPLLSIEFTAERDGFIMGFTAAMKLRGEVDG